MSSMFLSASSFNKNISAWEAGLVTNMVYMFTNASSFNQDISGWDVRSVTDMRSMFAMASAFNQDVSGWDVSHIVHMTYMFYKAPAFDQDISGWDVSNVIDRSDMFYGANLFNQNFCPWEDKNVCSSTSSTPVIGLTDFEWKVITPFCFATGDSSSEAPKLTCNSTSNAPGNIMTSLDEGLCSAGTPAANSAPEMTIALDENANCKNDQGLCTYTRFCVDVMYHGISMIAALYQVVTSITYDQSGIRRASINTSDFNSTEVSATTTQTANMLASVGACGVGVAPKDTYNLGDTASICVSTTDSGVTLALKSVMANPANQVLVNSEGVTNFVTLLTGTNSDKITLDTLMISAYYDGQNPSGAAGVVSIEGTAEIAYTRCYLRDGCVLTEIEEGPFALDIPLGSDHNTPEIMQAPVSRAGNFGDGFGLVGVVAAAAIMISAIFLAVCEEEMPSPLPRWKYQNYILIEFDLFCLKLSVLHCWLELNAY